MKILPVTDSSIIEEFASFAQKVRPREYAVGLASPEQTKQLIGLGLKLGSRFWLVQDPAGKTVLRLSARVSRAEEFTGTIGFFEADLQHPELTSALKLALSLIEEWFRTEKVKKIVAPIDLNTWFNYRFSTPGKHYFPRHLWEPTTPPEYETLFRTHGFEDFAYFHTVFFPHFRIGQFCIGTRPMKNSYKRIFDAGFRLRPFDMEKFQTHEIPLFHDISGEAFSDSLMFEPIDLETFRALYSGATSKFDITPSSVLISPEGEDVGFIFAFIDGDQLVIKSIAIRRKYQGHRLSSGMIFNAVKQGWAKGTKGTISALVRKGLASERIEKNVQKTMWFSRAHDYHLLKKDLP